MPFTCTAIVDHGFFREAPRSYGWPSGVEHAFGMPESFPQLFGSVRREWRNELHQRLDLGAIRRTLATPDTFMYSIIAAIAVL